MVTTVAGKGLGLLDTSLHRIGQAVVLEQGALEHGNGRAFVNAVTGNLVLQAQDEQLSGRGLDLHAGRTYNSLGSPDDGDGWRWGYEHLRLSAVRAASARPTTAAVHVRPC